MVLTRSIIKPGRIITAPVAFFVKKLDYNLFVKKLD
jgi:hypothetical protein